PRASVFVSKGSVYESTNGGVRWNNISGNLPTTPTDSILLGSNNTIYVGDDAGLYQSSNDGANWNAVATGLPHAQVISLELNQTLGVFAAGTRGRGLWELALPATAQVIGGVLTIQGSVGADDIVLQIDPANSSLFDVLENGVPLLVTPLNSFNSIQMNGNGGDDTLTVNYGNGLFRQPVTYDGGIGTNQLAVTGAT